MRAAAFAAAALALAAGCMGAAPAADLGGEVAGVRLARAPDGQGATSEACWAVDGVGRIARTEVRWHAESHAKNPLRRVDLYDGGVALPGNVDRPSRDGYLLPGYFCARVPSPDFGSYYVVAHAAGRLSDEAVVRAPVALG